MTHPVEIRFMPAADADLSEREGRLALIVGERDQLPKGLPGPVRKSLSRALGSKAWAEVKPGGAMEIAFPAGLAADAVQLVRLPRRADAALARKAGAAIGARMGKGEVTVVCDPRTPVADLTLGIALRGYDFPAYKSAPQAEAGAEETAGDLPAAAPQSTTHGAAPDARLNDAAGAEPEPGTTGKTAEPPQPEKARVTVLCADPEAAAREAQAGAALAEGVFFTRDLVNEPANVLTTTDFADRLLAMRELGLEVEVLDEDELARLGMRALLAVGQGSESPTKVVVMRWQGGGEEAPFAIVGKGVVFDTGGISIKPAQGMEEMTMDMGGAGVVAGVMRTLALRRAKANVVGLVGLVENMPDGRAQRPGDIVRSMKGNSIEVVNTDAEGRMVLADVLWYAQDRFQPAAVVNLATLTGAIIVALGHEKAGLFSNDDALAGDLLRAADATGEGLWRMPLGPAYDDLIKSRLADMKNSGGRPAGSITAAQFLQRFIRKGTPWAHLDIAGVALPPGETTLAPKGPTGWGVMTLDRLIRDRFEAE
ncbi:MULTISPECIES: leucyl aminopeptidase [unclassified Paracoccus (in: a-proteobacteria)]|uniref:leucyl aminopeptidase n=1 Tax=unclassified Paracoccus (in: a-proteobacteria) TaxID=2688777 RepID=UPI0015FEF9C6|nr:MULTISPECIES: leucyl aminopeptidase [unclassified Paracoccus (in: a-proteobacteria)]MBB1490436.1 leucyl aminopeptidase [Paracoccus sp. MC1854]MBB1497279.1 leucyl aminopeptidase [Paracoccus sp. MC1862]QQO44754.1 leucyl aminopeptidase [Paracoccus sp. MC1862]